MRNRSEVWQKQLKYNMPEEMDQAKQIRDD